MASCIGTMLVEEPRKREFTVEDNSSRPKPQQTNGTRRIEKNSKDGTKAWDGPLHRDGVQNLQLALQ